MMEAEKPNIPIFERLKKLIQNGDFATFTAELDKLPEPIRTDLITRNQSTNASTLFSDLISGISANQKNQILAEHLQSEPLEMIKQAKNIEEPNRLLRVYFIDHPEQFNNFLIAVIDTIPEKAREEILKRNHCPKELSDPKSSSSEKTAALGKFLSKRTQANSLLTEALMNGRSDIFEYLQQKGAKAEDLIFDSASNLIFDGQHAPFVGNRDNFTGNSALLEDYNKMHKLQFENVFKILNKFNSEWSTSQKNDNRLLNIAVFFGHKELVASLLKEDGIDPNLKCSRNRSAITHASANRELRGDIYQSMLENPTVQLDGTGIASYVYLTDTAEEFEKFIDRTKGKISSLEFPPLSIATTFSNTDLSAQDASRKFELLFTKKLINLNLLKEQIGEFNDLAGGLPISTRATVYAVVSRELVKSNELTQNLQGAEPTAWDVLVKKVSKDPELQKFLEASAGVSNEVDELNKAVKKYNSRSLARRMLDSLTPTNKKDEETANKLFAQMKETQTNAASLGIPSLMVDKLLSNLHEAEDGPEKDQALEQIAKNAGLFKGSSFEDLVKTAETRMAVKAKRAPEIAKLMDGMDDIQRRLTRKKVPDLIDNFRNAKGDKELLEAAKDILAYRKNFEDKDKHFVAVAEKIVHTKDKNTKPAVPHTKIGTPDKAAAIAELEQFMENLKQGTTKSLTANVSNIVISNTNNSIGINFINGDKTESAYIRAETGVIDFLSTVNAHTKPQNTLERLEALKEVIFEKYPLTSHLINPSAQSKYLDHLALMQYGSHFQEKDPGFAQRWQRHNQLKVEFTQRLKEFIESGMKKPNPAEFEQYMQETSKEVAEMYKKDMGLMPDDSPTKYGKKSKKEALEKVNTHIQGIDPKSEHLSQALGKAQPKQDLQKYLIKTISTAQVIPAIWDELVKKVSKEPALLTLLEASAEASPHIKALNEAVEKYNSRSFPRRVWDALTPTNKKEVEAAGKFFTQMQKTQTDAASFGISSLVTDKRIIDFHKAGGHKEKDQVLEQIHSKAGPVVITEQEKRKTEIAKLMDGMDDIRGKIDKMKGPGKFESAEAAKSSLPKPSGSKLLS